MARMTTSITVNPLTLKWVNAIRSLLEYHTGIRLTLDQTLLMMAQTLDWRLAKELHMTSKEYAKYIIDRKKIFYEQFTKEEQEEIKKIISTGHNEETNEEFDLFAIIKRKKSVS